MAVFCEHSYVPAPIDFSAFTAAMSEAEIAAYRNEKPPGKLTWDAGTIGCLAVLIVILLGIIGGGVAAVVWAVSSALNGSTGPAIGVGTIGLMIGGFIAFVAIATRGPAPRGPWEQWTRLDRFARENGLRFQASDTATPSAGSIFQVGDARVVSNRISSSDASLDIGNYSYSVGAGKSRQFYDWGYLAIRLERVLPHFVLDSTSNNGRFGSGRLPASFDKRQVLPLEGDFNAHFTLYAPTGSETDALYVFTPDLMALLIDEAGAYDVEIVDDWMFVYSPVPFDTGGDSNASAATLQRLFRIADTVGAKARSQTDRYLDAAAPDFASNVVAPTAARLRRPRVSYAAIGSGIVTVIGVVLGIAIAAVALVLIVLVVYSMPR